jgi:hypothetical protein
MSQQIETLARRLTRGLQTERARAVRLHDFVRDRIEFGFTARLDDASPEEALFDGVGPTITKTTLFVALLRAVGLRAQQHFVTIDHDILRGVFGHATHRLLPWEILHSYAEVEIDGHWCSIDSYALDAALWRGATARLAAEGALLGYGAHRDGTYRWSGTGHAFAQLATRDMVVEDHGTFADPCEFRQGGAPVRVRSSTRLLEFASEAVAAASARCINAHLDALRGALPRSGVVAASV